MHFLDIMILQNTIQSWLIAITATFVAALVLGLIKTLARRRLAKAVRGPENPLAGDVIETLTHTRPSFLAIVSLYAGSRFIELPGRSDHIFGSIVIIALFIQLGLWASTMANEALKRYRDKQMKENPASVTTINAIGFVGRLVLWTVVFLLALANLGIDITALVAGLGIGGIAVALAVQNILGDLLAALSIVLDKPFAVGDFLIVDEHLGSVEYVGLKTTRLRSLSGEQLVFSNSDLLSSRLRNFGRMYERRVVFHIGVTYQTPRDKLKKVPLILRQAIEAQGDKVRFDRAHFKEYGSYSLDFEIVYYVHGPDYNLYMDIQQAINFLIHEQFESEGIEFAYPTQVIHLEGGEKPISVHSSGAA